MYPSFVGINLRGEFIPRVSSYPTLCAKCQGIADALHAAGGQYYLYLCICIGIVYQRGAATRVIHRKAQQEGGQYGVSKVADSLQPTLGTDTTLFLLTLP